jgi:23S rRNA (cytidine1920-2'-O)/16S rRNA (cytidine1409-2'-O)-methyltransferase
MPGRKRADALLFEQGLAASRDMASRLIMSGRVFSRIPGQGMSAPVRVDKAGELLPEETLLLVREKEPFVGRGAYKLLTALEYFKIDVTGRIALDAGASTGGFTDCLLQRGAARVYAVDVGKTFCTKKSKATVGWSVWRESTCAWPGRIFCRKRWIWRQRTSRLFP